MKKLTCSSIANVKAVLSKISSFPKKNLGQNFLIDGNIVRKILLEAEVKSNDYILEIGPGLGSLTEALVMEGAEVLAVEKDISFREILSCFSIEIQFIDIRDFSLFSMKRQGKLVANLPYHISSLVLSKFVKEYNFFTDIVVMVQKEMADRIVAKPNSSDYSSLSVMLQFYSDVHYAFKVSPKCFYPIPKVSSAVVHLKLKKDYLLPIESHQLFFNMVRMAFQQRRKKLINSLSNAFSKEKISNSLKELGKNENVRAENLSVRDFSELFLLLKE